MSGRIFHQTNSCLPRSSRNEADPFPLGAHLCPDACTFRVWAPNARFVDVEVALRKGEAYRLEPVERGYHEGIIPGLVAGDHYFYRQEGGGRLPDPASRSQPLGVHGPSAICGTAFAWNDASWAGIAPRDLVLYELHVGTFSPEGTFDGIIPRLESLRELGITALELMPVAQFPGARNWGYDGVFPFAVHNTYGGPEGLKRLINAAHKCGLAVIMDVVYNHLGPEGNYLASYGPYFTDRYQTAWGSALNFDGPGSSEVREFFLQNALQWKEEFHVDGLRLDAVHSIYDSSAYSFLEELSDRLNANPLDGRRPFHLIAESDLNQPRMIQPRLVGGYGLEAQWNDDFHHALHVQLTGEQGGYYEDFGELSMLAKAFRHGYGFTGDYSKFRQRHHGRHPSHALPHQFVVYSQNHDQVGNRGWGERLSALVSFSELKLAAASVLLSPYTPLLFMGEEFGASSPFLYFTDHSDPELIKAVQEGRRKEFAAFAWKGETPDPQSVATYEKSKLDHSQADLEERRSLRKFYAGLIDLRKKLGPLLPVSLDDIKVELHSEARTLVVSYGKPPESICLILCFHGEATKVLVHLPEGDWIKRMDTVDGEGSGFRALLVGGSKICLPLPPKSAVLYQRDTSNAMLDQ